MGNADKKVNKIGTGSVLTEFAGVVARAVVEPSRDIEPLRGRMGESTRQVLGRVYRDLEGLFESLLAQSFDGGR